MKIKETFILRKIASTKVIIPVENSIADFDGVMAVNETAAFLFEQLQIDISINELVKRLIEEYEISEEDALEDVMWFLDVLEKKNMMA